MDRVLISVVVPVYNVQNYVLKCLKSLAQQDYENLEIIIVDDGSTDESGKICDEFAKTEKRAKVYHKKNGGLSNARNYGIKKSKGQFIALVDGDDFVDENFIGAMIREVKVSGADVVICGFNQDVPRAITVTGEEATKKLLTRQENLEIVAWNKLYRRELFVENDIWYPVGMKHEDALTTYKLLSRAKKVAYVNKSLYHYVERKDSIMAEAKVLDRLKVRELAAQEAVKYFDNDYDLKEAAEVSLLLAKYAYMDVAVKGEVGDKYFEMNSRWIKDNREKFRDNKYLTTKLKLYDFLVSMHLYKIFRKIA